MDSFYQEWNWEIVIVSNLQDLLKSIKAGKGYSVSNGSFQSGRGAAAWIIKGHGNTNWLLGTCHCPSNADQHSSFQSKLAGIYATLYTLNSLLPQSKDKPTLQFACDRKLVLPHLKRTQITDPNKPHANLLSATRYLMSHSPVYIDLHHVKGHQDANTCFIKHWSWCTHTE